MVRFTCRPKSISSAAMFNVRTSGTILTIAPKGTGSDPGVDCGQLSQKLNKRPLQIRPLLRIGAPARGPKIDK